MCRFHEALGTATFKKGDGPLDEMLEDARGKFLNRDIEVRRESLERPLGRVGAAEDS